MIKVIAFDLDGTLLGSDHGFAPQTVSQLHAAQSAGFHLIVVTGRDEYSAKEALAGTGILCDWITSSGAKIVRQNGEIIRVQYLSDADKRWIHQQVKPYLFRVTWCGVRARYCIGSQEEKERGVLERLSVHMGNADLESIREMPQFQKMSAMTHTVRTFEELSGKEPQLYKMLLISPDLCFITEYREKLSRRGSLAVAATSQFDIEITDAKAQKGLALNYLIAELGYVPHEVMVFGDSLNDLSMLSMDFGATVAMGNASVEIKRTAKYVTKTNDELGVAHTIERLINHQGIADNINTTIY